ncbi:MAG: hypothetical protein Fur0042_09750 [Cyanophyceae cyanobacterium]
MGSLRTLVTKLGIAASGGGLIHWAQPPRVTARAIAIAKNPRPAPDQTPRPQVHNPFTTEPHRLTVLCPIDGAIATRHELRIAA